MGFKSGRGVSGTIHWANAESFRYGEARSSAGIQGALPSRDSGWLRFRAP